MSPQIKKKLQLIRRNIDQIDDQIVDLLKRRLTLAQKVGKIKASCGEKIYDRQREREILNRLSDSGNTVLSTAEIHGVYQRILKISRNRQRRIIQISSRQ
ncbi:MAG: chorismate mutase [Verrucomicrobiae bacterium]|nr:chorismate mutase [Verrucomicrobiae bacterium]